MTQEKLALPRRSAAPAEGSKKGALWERFGLAAVLVLAAVLNLYAITSLGYGNTYYAAAVKNMIQSPHNFFFVAYDAGFVSVDKPPLGLWIQGLFALVFGFHGWSILLPQALAGVASVAVLHRLVARSFGKLAALVAALTLALTPIVVATSRNNTADMLLVLAVLLAAWAVTKAAETGRLRWLLACAAIVGLGFNIKMMQAFLVLPAFYLFYLLATRIPWWKRFAHLAAATVVLIAVSFSWATAVDLTPKSERPYVGSSTGDSVYNLIFGYNGFQRLLGDSNPLAGLLDNSAETTQAQNADSPAAGGGGMVPNEYGAKGPLRLLNQNMAGQISWLLPLAVVGAAAVAYGKGRPRYPLGRRYGGLVLWGTWGLTTAAYFSVASEGHRYYLVMLAPPLAALVGAGISALWQDYREGDWRAWALPAALVATAAAQAYMLSGYEGWNRYLTPVIAVLCGLAAVLLVAARLGRRRFGVRYAAAAATVGVLSLFVAPAAWASYTVFDGSGGGQPAAGPQVAGAMGGPGGGTGPGGPPPRAGQKVPAQDGARGQGASQAPPGGMGQGGPGAGGPGGGRDGRDQADTKLIEYLEEHQGDAEYLVAGTSSMSTDSIILNTDQPVVDMGGFQGRDPVFTVDQISTLVSEGKLKYFLIQGSGGAQGGQDAPQGSTGQQNAADGAAQDEAGTAAAANPPQGAPPQGNPPQGAPPQGAPSGGMPQGAPPQGMPPQGAPPQGAPQGAPSQGNSPVQGGSSAQGGEQPSASGGAPAGEGQANEPGAQPGGAGMPAGGPGGQQAEITQWVQKNCEAVPEDEYRSDGSAQGGGPMGQATLYACDAGSAATSDTATGTGSGASGGAVASTPALSEAAASRRYEAAA